MPDNSMLVTPPFDLSTAMAVEIDFSGEETTTTCKHGMAPHVLEMVEEVRQGVGTRTAVPTYETAYHPRRERVATTHMFWISQPLQVVPFFDACGVVGRGRPQRLHWHRLPQLLPSLPLHNPYPFLLLKKHILVPKLT